MKRLFLILPAAVLGAFLPTTPTAVADDVRYSFELSSGMAHNVGTSFEVEQQGFDILRFDASYSAESLKVPWYWAMRLSRSTAQGEWSVELMHHKVLLDSPPPEIQSFSISHGFNVVTVQRAWPWRGFLGRVGAGVVVAHPESQVRNLRRSETQGFLGTGYYLRGPVATLAVGRRVPLSSWLSVSLEGRMHAAPMSVPIAGGTARFNSFVFHLLVGLAAIGF